LKKKTLSYFYIIVGEDWNFCFSGAGGDGLRFEITTETDLNPLMRVLAITKEHRL
jgi:hypothetical protein